MTPRGKASQSGLGVIKWWRRSQRGLVRSIAHSGGRRRSKFTSLATRQASRAANPATINTGRVPTGVTRTKAEVAHPPCKAHPNAAPPIMATPAKTAAIPTSNAAVNLAGRPRYTYPSPTGTGTTFSSAATHGVFRRTDELRRDLRRRMVTLKRTPIKATGKWTLMTNRGKDEDEAALTGPLKPAPRNLAGSGGRRVSVYTWSQQA